MWPPSVVCVIHKRGGKEKKEEGTKARCSENGSYLPVFRAFPDEFWFVEEEKKGQKGPSPQLFAHRNKKKLKTWANKSVKIINDGQNVQSTSTQAVSGLSLPMEVNMLPRTRGAGGGLPRGRLSRKPKNAAMPSAHKIQTCVSDSSMGSDGE